MLSLRQQPAASTQLQPHKAAQRKPELCVQQSSAGGLCTCGVGRLTPKHSRGVTKRGLALAGPGEQECCARKERQGRPPCDLKRSGHCQAMPVQLVHTYEKLSYDA